MNKKALFVLLCVIIGLNQSVQADQYDTMRNRVLVFKALGNKLDASDSDVKTYQTSLDALVKTAWTNMQKSPASKGYLWSEYNKLTGDEDVTPGHVYYSYNNLRNMARAWATPASAYYNNADLLKDIKMALTFLYNKAYNAKTSYIGNWYEWRIGIPECYGHIVAILYSELSSTEVGYYKTSVSTAINGVISSDNMTYANLANLCQEMITLGIITKTSSYIQTGLDHTIPVFVEKTTTAQRNSAQSGFATAIKNGQSGKTAGAKKEGYYPDGSFIQHVAIPYIGAYGLEMIEYAAYLGLVFENMSFKVPAEILPVLPGLIQNTYLPSIYRGEEMLMLMGRSVSVDPAMNAVHILMSCYNTAWKLLGDYPTAQKQIMADCGYLMRLSKYNYTIAYNSLIPTRDKYFIQKIKQEPATDITDTVFTKFYPCSDRLIHQKKKYRFALSMSSIRIGKFESINDMNLNGWYLGDGMTYMYLPSAPTHYQKYLYNNINWYRLPGTTVDGSVRSAATSNYGIFGLPKNAKDWVGGVVLLGQYATAGMDLVGELNSLTAHKSWFCFDDEIVCLGSAISMSEKNKVETIIETRNSKAQLSLNGADRANTKGVEMSHENVNYAHLEGTGGYWFPQPAAIRSYLSYDGYTYLYYNHGEAPSNAQYAYVLLPNMTKDETAQYAAKRPVYVLANERSKQGVLHKATGVAGINFWSSGTLYGVTSDGAASVMFLQNGSYLNIAVSDPTQKRTSVVLTLDGEFTLRSCTPSGLATVTAVSGGKTKVTLNTTNRWGQAISLSLKGTLKVPDIDDPLPVKTAYESQSVPKKYMLDGQIVIETGNSRYNLLGQPIAK